MLHIKFRGNRPAGSVKDFWRVFTIYGHGGHLGHAANKLSFPLPKEAPHKIWLWLAKRFWRRSLSIVDGWATDGWTLDHEYPISSPFYTYLAFLAHLSRRLTGELIVYQSSRRPSVQHFQTWISLQPVGGLEWNFIWSIIGVGERLQWVLIQIGSDLWFTGQQIAPIEL